VVRVFGQGRTCRRICEICKARKLRAHDRNRRTFTACGTETREHVNTVSLFPVSTAMRQSADHFCSGSGMTGMTGVAGMTGMNNQIAERILHGAMMSERCQLCSHLNPRVSNPSVFKRGFHKVKTWIERRHKGFGQV